ncbi:MAG: TIGR02266 family protein [Kofleriaceae bacterium]
MDGDAGLGMFEEPVREIVLVDPNTRQGKRTPVTLKIKFKSETLEQFIERYAVDVSQGGIFVRTKEPLGVGTQMRFEFQLKDASPLIAGEGTVVWTRENDPSRPAIAPGMGVRFDRLAEGSQNVLERILAEKAKQAPQRANNTTSKPPMFSDTPTRVAPAPVQEALLGDKDNGQKRKRPDSFGEQGTPLPKPTPWHSDAEDFPEEAFEEATKVRALDDLIAQTAADTESTKLPDSKDQLEERRRADSTIADPPPPAAESLPDLGAAAMASTSSDAGRPSPRLLDTSPSPRTEPSGPHEVPGGSNERMKAPSRPPIKDAETITSGIRPALPAEPSHPELPTAPSKSSAPTIMLVLTLLVGGAAAVWFFVLRDPGTKPAPSEPLQGSAFARPSDRVEPPTPPPTQGSADNGAGSDSAGSAVAAGSAGSGSADAANAGSAIAPAGDLAPTVISASVEGATVEIVGAGLSGPAPFTAKLEKTKPYKARVVAPGFVPLEIDVTGGQAKATAKLVAKPKLIAITSTPAGAMIYIDSGPIGHQTPYEVPLSKAQAAKKSLRVTLRKSGFKPVEKVLDASAFVESDTNMVAKVEETMTVQAAPRPRPPANPTNPTPPDPGPGSGEGSANPGSASPPPPPPPTDPAPTPPAPTPTPTGGAGSGTAPAPGTETLP